MYACICTCVLQRVVLRYFDPELLVDGVVGRVSAILIVRLLRPEGHGEALPATVLLLAQAVGAGAAGVGDATDANLVSKGKLGYLRSHLESKRVDYIVS